MKDHPAAGNHHVDLMAKLMDLADIYANAVADNSGDDNAQNNRLEMAEEAARLDLAGAIEEVLVERHLATLSRAPGQDVKDAQRMDHLDKNIFHREMSDWDKRLYPGHSMWVTFAPEGVQGSARKILDAAIQSSAHTAGGRD
jgi:hypothetical protein